jgi:hypothetical protein
MMNAIAKSVLLVIFAMVAGCATSNIYIVRHAEKDSTPKK